MDIPSFVPSRASRASTLSQWKAQAGELQLQAVARGETLTRSHALETVARLHGFSSWNAASAAAREKKSDKTATHFAFEDIDAPLPRRPFRIRSSGDILDPYLSELYRWAKQLDFIGNRVHEDDRYDALSLIGGDRPYVFVRDANRWPDGIFHLCDRGYEALDDIALSLDELDKVGVVAWEGQYGSHGGTIMFSVIGDEVMSSRDPIVLRKAARLLVSIAAAVDTKMYGPRSY